MRNEQTMKDNTISKLYVSNLSLQSAELTIGVLPGDEEKEIPSWANVKSSSSTNELIETSKPRLLPQVVAASLACWSSLASGASVGFVTPAIPSLMDSTSRISITEDQSSWVASLGMLGALVGGLLAGPSISTGRKRALWVASMPLLVCWLLIVFAQNIWMIYAACLVFGVLMGIICDAAQLYVCETSHANWRGAIGCIPVVMFNIGILLAYAAGSCLQWEMLAVFGACITFPALLLPWVLPETPSYLVAKDRIEEACRALQWLRGPDYDITGEYQELLRCEKGPSLVDRLKELSQFELLKPVFLTAMVRILSRFCGFRAILSYTDEIFKASKSPLKSTVGVVITGVVQVLATIAACAVLDKLGRRILLMVSQFVMAGALVGLGCYLYFQEDADGTHATLGWLPLVTIVIYIVANSMGLGPISGIMIGELVPQRHRSIASSLTGAISWLSAFAVTKTFFNLLDTIHLQGTMWLYGGVCLFGVLFVFLFIPETRGISQYGIEILFQKKGPSKALEIAVEIERRKST